MLNTETPLQLVSEAELARLTATSVNFWRRHRKNGTGPTHVLLGERTVRSSVVDVEARLKARRRGEGTGVLRLLRDSGDQGETP
jgi:hypothetical protein